MFKNRGTRRRNEDADQAAPAERLSAEGRAGPRADPHPEARHLNEGAQRPDLRTRPINPQTSETTNLWPKAGAVNRVKSSTKCEKSAAQVANIKQAVHNSG